LADEGDSVSSEREAAGRMEDGDLGGQEQLGVVGDEELDAEGEERLEEPDGIGVSGHDRSPPSDWTTRARMSLSTALRWRRAARRRAAVASRSMSRRLPAAASCSKASASLEKSSLAPPTRVIRMRT